MPTDLADLVAHPEVVRWIERLLRLAWVRPQDVKDGIADVQLRMLASLNNKLPFFWPKTVGEMTALAIHSTRTHLIDRYNKAKRRRELGDVGLAVDNPDDHEAQSRPSSERDPLDHQKIMMLLDELVKESRKPDLDAQILEALMKGLDQAEISNQVGLSHQQIRDRLRAIRRALRAKAAALGMGALAVVVFFAWPRGPDGQQEAHYHRHADDVLLHDATPLQLAADLRERARPFCQNAQWDDCMVFLNAAARLDPEGDRALAIQAVRDRVQRERDDVMRERESKIGPPPPAPSGSSPQPAPSASSPKAPNRH